METFKFNKTQNPKILIWMSTLALKEKDLNDLVSYLKKATKVVQEEIGEAKDNSKLKIEIIFRQFSKGEKGIEELLTFVNNNPEIIAINGHFTSQGNEAILSRLDLHDIIYFSQFALKNYKGYDGLSDQEKQNYFSLKIKDEELKSGFIKHLVKQKSNKAKVTFLFGRPDIGNQVLIKDLENEVKNLKKIDLSKVKEKDKTKFLESFLHRLNENDIVVLNDTFQTVKVVFDYANSNGCKATIIKLYGSIEGRFENISFPLIELTSKNKFPSLSFEALCSKIDPKMSESHKILISDSFWRFEIPLLLSYCLKNMDSSLFQKNDLLGEISTQINKIDGSNDISIGKTNYFAFQKNENSIQSLNAYLFPKVLQDSNNFFPIFYPEQIIKKETKTHISPVTSVFVDIIRVTQIDIGQSIWSCEFFLDIVSLEKDAINTITFNNLSLISSKFECKLIRSVEEKSSRAYTNRYYIVANFDFLSVADNYPFDWQHIYISMSSTNPDKYGVLQPVPPLLQDLDFQLDGWRLEENKSGILRKKETHHIGRSLDNRTEIREEIRVGWTLARTNVINIMKIAIPMTFLMLLNYYTVFLGYGNVSSSVGILTTTFLSGIALYFSTEKPAPLRITTIDLIFIYYYLQVGVLVMVTAISGLIGEGAFNLSMLLLKFIMPASILTGIFILFKRIRSVRLRPRID